MPRALSFRPTDFGLHIVESCSAVKGLLIVAMTILLTHPAPGLTDFPAADSWMLVFNFPILACPVLTGTLIRTHFGD